ncbi:S-layer homology domain-containing protein [Brevibacillus panacihumi]|uniref:S-layer homology domain-containing protein n=1 Tax=Brevibacillus panacihumi TaxID=497735 RepID=A0A3M8CSU4_9BACL|nr:S-layer homology domain-containing protein [Brevibacillus panacihumi]RNB77915.1 S-layer homology domain-containing protein [Brevibacillus panacihumi]
MTFKRILFCFLMLLLVAQNALTGSASAQSPYMDIRGHWAQDDIEYLANLGILKGDGRQSFYPDKHISRGEAIALLNRVFESVYGPLAKPERKGNLDYRYNSRWEIEQLLANLRALYRIETGIVTDYDPGDRMLYYLYLAESGKLMRKPEKDNPEWWLSSTALQRPLTREEASMVLFHMMTPQKFRGINIKPEDAKSYFTSFYEWKQDSYYRDTYSPYATAISEYGLFGASDEFNPYEYMTRAQYAVVLTRLHSFYERDVVNQFTGPSNARHVKAAQAYLAAASLAYEKNDQARLSKFFDSSILKKWSDFPFKPKHTEHINLTARIDEGNKKKLIVVGQYKDNANGTYQIEYVFEADEYSPFGRRLVNVIYKQK